MKEKDSLIEGKGLFAERDFKQGEVLCLFQGQEISDEYADALYQKGFDYILQVSKRTFLILKGQEKFINHSCSPNGAFLNKSAELVALRDIKKGEEITFDYSANEGTEFEFLCQCQSPNCRKVIRPYPKLTSHQKKEISSLLTPHLRCLERL